MGSKRHHPGVDGKRVPIVVVSCAIFVAVALLVLVKALRPASVTVPWTAWDTIGGKSMLLFLMWFLL